MAAPATAARAAPPAKGRGFFAADVAELLRKRQELSQALEEGCLLRSDDLSSESSEWEGGKAASEDEGEAKQVPKGDAEISVDGISFEELKKRFANQPFADLEPGVEWFEEDVGPLINVQGISVVDSGPMGGSFARRGSMVSQSTKNSVSTRQHTEPVARRLARVRGEVDALCAWASSRQEAKPSEAKGQSALAQEAAKLREELGDVAGMVQQASKVPSAEGSAKRVWLPPQEEDNYELIKNLVDMNLHAESMGHDAQGRPGAHAGGFTYSLTAGLGQKGGWLAPAETQVLSELEQRIQRVSQVLGKAGVGASGSADPGGGLAGATARLHRRLDALHHVHDDALAKRLQSAVQLLSAEIDATVSEGRHLEAVEADVSQDLGGEETVAQQVARLHEQVSGMDDVARRVMYLRKTLAAQEEPHRELSYFCRDLSDAERQARHAADLLVTTGEVIRQMKETAEANKKQLLVNLATLEKRLQQWQAKHPSASRDDAA